MILNEILDALTVENVGDIRVEDRELIKDILMAVSRGNSAASIEQIKKIHRGAYHFILGYVGDGDIPVYVSEDSMISVGTTAETESGSVIKAGAIWFNAATGITYVYDGTDWVKVGE